MKSDSTTAPNSVVLESALKRWWDAYPTAVSSANTLECREVAYLIRNPKLDENDFLVVDVRRADHAVGVFHQILRVCNRRD